MALREGKGLTQAKAAYANDTDAGTWSRWERGVAYPRAEQLKTLARYFGVSIDHLLFGDESVAFTETQEWNDFVASPYGEIARDRGWLDELKRIRLPVPMTAKVYEMLVHTLLSRKP